MSVSLALIPVALALRVVMGKNNFENWVESHQTRVETHFETELELVRTVKKAGYDAEKYGSSIKTHVGSKNDFFFWEFIDGKWQAVFSKGDDQKKLATFMAAVEAAAGRKVFGSYSQAVAEQQAQPVVTKFPTNFRDGSLLYRALTEFGATPEILSNGEVVCVIDNSRLRFSRIGDGPYTVEVSDAPKLQDVYQYLNEIDEDYKRCVQAVVYDKVKERAAARNMTIESEEVLEDNSIVITLNVQG